MNILIANDATVAGDWRIEGWATAIGLFGGQKLLQTIATLAMIQNDIDVGGENYDEALSETIAELICTQIGKRRENGSPRPPTDDEVQQISGYLKHSVKALRPYMPSGGSLELVTYLTDPKSEIIYLVVRYHPEDEHSGKAFASPSLRG